MVTVIITKMIFVRSCCITGMILMIIILMVLIVFFVFLMKYLPLFLLLQVTFIIHTAPSQAPQVLSAKERRRKKDHVRGSVGLQGNKAL